MKKTLESSGKEATEANGETGVEINLPWPPSVNQYYRTFRGRMILSKSGRAYQSDVESLIAGKTITGPVSVEIQAFRPDKRRRDLDNVLKAALDALTHIKIWEDDSQISDLRIFWAPEMGGFLKIKVTPR